MYEASKAAKRRFNSGAFLTRYFVGRGLDVGAGPDGLSRYAKVFPGISSVRDWDVSDGDGQVLPGVEENSYDFVHSSHCLEHLRDPALALSQWLRVVRPDGFVICVVPSQELYEHNQWPSLYGEGHKFTFRAEAESEIIPLISINLIEMLANFQKDGRCSLERYEVLRDFYDHALGMADQTMLPNVEAGIEFVLRKHR